MEGQRRCGDDDDAGAVLSLGIHRHICLLGFDGIHTIRICSIGTSEDLLIDRIRGVKPIGMLSLSGVSDLSTLITPQGSFTYRSHG